MRDNLQHYADRIVQCLYNNGIDNYIRHTIKGSQIRFYFLISDKEKCYVIDGELYKDYLHAMPYEVANYLTYYVKSAIELR